MPHKPITNMQIIIISVVHLDIKGFCHMLDLWELVTGQGLAQNFTIIVIMERMCVDGFCASVTKPIPKIVTINLHSGYF